MRAKALTLKLASPREEKDMANRMWDVRPVWDVQSEIQYLLTPAEKAARRRSAEGDAGNASRPSSGGAEKKIHVPLAAMLRQDNIVGGPFLLTSGQRMPQIVLRFLETNP